jgi:hypothetical protein
VLNQLTRANVANATASRLRHGPCRRITSVLKSRVTDSARALDHPRRAAAKLRRIPTLSSHEVHPFKEWALRQNRYDSQLIVGWQSNEMETIVANREMLSVPIAVVNQTVEVPGAAIAGCLLLNCLLHRDTYVRSLDLHQYFRNPLNGVLA